MAPNRKCIIQSMDWEQLADLRVVRPKDSVVVSASIQATATSSDSYWEWETVAVPEPVAAELPKASAVDFFSTSRITENLVKNAAAAQSKTEVIVNLEATTASDDYWAEASEPEPSVQQHTPLHSQVVNSDEYWQEASAKIDSGADYWMWDSSVPATPERQTSHHRSTAPRSDNEAYWQWSHSQTANDAYWAEETSAQISDIYWQEKCHNLATSDLYWNFVSVE